MCQMSRLSPSCHHLSCLSCHLWTQSLAHCLSWCCFLPSKLPFELHSGRAAPVSLTLRPSQVPAIYSLSCISSALPVRKATSTCPVWFELDFPAVSHWRCITFCSPHDHFLRERGGILLGSFQFLFHTNGEEFALASFPKGSPHFLALSQDAFSSEIRKENLCIKALPACWSSCFLVSFSVMSNSTTLWTVALQAPLFMEFPRQEYWSGWPSPSPGNFPNPGIKPASPASQADSLALSHGGMVCILTLS